MGVEVIEDHMQLPARMCASSPHPSGSPRENLVQNLTVPILRVFTHSVNTQAVAPPSLSTHGAESRGVTTQSTSNAAIEEARMSAMQWLVTQLAWEQRLGQLRTGEPGAGVSAREAHEAHEARQAA